VVEAEADMAARNTGTRTTVSNATRNQNHGSALEPGTTRLVLVLVPALRVPALAAFRWAPQAQSQGHPSTQLNRIHLSSPSVCVRVAGWHAWQPRKKLPRLSVADPRPTRADFLALCWGFCRPALPSCLAIPLSNASGLNVLPRSC